MLNCSYRQIESLDMRDYEENKFETNLIQHGFIFKGLQGVVWRLFARLWGTHLNLNIAPVLDKEQR